MMRRTVARPTPVPSNSAAECRRWNTPNSLSAYFMSKPAPLSRTDRKSTRLNSSHLVISYAVFCLKKKICRHRLRPQNVGYSNFSQPQSHLSFRVLLQYLVERRRVVTQLGPLG